MLGARLNFSESGPARGSGVGGGEGSGLTRNGSFHSLLPLQLMFDDKTFMARFLRGDLLYRARSGREPPRLRPVVVALDVSPAVSGVMETISPFPPPSPPEGVR